MPCQQESRASTTLLNADQLTSLSSSFPCASLENLQALIAGRALSSERL